MGAHTARHGALLNKIIVGRAVVGSLPMMGKLKKLNATDPKAVFEQLKAIRHAAMINKTYGGDLHATRSLRQGLRRIKQEGLGVLTRVNAYAGERLWIRPLEDLKLIREVLGMGHVCVCGREHVG